MPVMGWETVVGIILMTFTKGALGSFLYFFFSSVEGDLFLTLKRFARLRKGWTLTTGAAVSPAGNKFFWAEATSLLVGVLCETGVGGTVAGGVGTAAEFCSDMIRFELF